MKTIWLLLLGCMIGFAASAQNELDIYRFSNTLSEGSARFEAMGGAFGALGADPGVARINPAGFGRYSSSSVGFTTGWTQHANSAAFFGTERTTQLNQFSVTQMHAVYVSDRSKRQQGYLYTQFGIGFNRIADFNRTYQYEGQQFESLLDAFAGQATGIDPIYLSSYFPFTSSMAFETNTMDYDGMYYMPRLTSGDMWHKRTIRSSGGIHEAYVNYSANYKNKLYIGANVGLQILRYEEQTKHHEQLLETSGVSLRSFDYDYRFSTRGTGLNIKAGMIYLPTESLRFGLSFHSLTSLNLTDNASAEMSATHTDGIHTVPNSLKPDLEYKYKLNTPARLITSLAYVWKSKGCVNVDVEWTNYGWGKLQASKDKTYQAYDFNYENKAADDRFTNALNVRIGWEYILLKRFFLRGGYALLPTADRELHQAVMRYDHLLSGGIGVRFNKISIDCSYKQLNSNRFYEAFAGSRADFNSKIRSVMLSATLRLP